MLRRRGISEHANLIDSMADELEDAVHEFRVAPIGLKEASKMTGLAYDTVQRKVSRGEIPNVGRRGSPRVRRCDLVADEVLINRIAF